MGAWRYAKTETPQWPIYFARLVALGARMCCVGNSTVTLAAAIPRHSLLLIVAAGSCFSDTAMGAHLLCRGLTLSVGHASDVQYLRFCAQQKSMFS